MGSGETGRLGAFEDAKAVFLSPIGRASVSVKPFPRPVVCAFHRRCHWQDPCAGIRSQLPIPPRRNRL